MNALVKKEIRLLLPSWIVAMLLALVQGITRPYDFYVASLLFFGLTMMALTTIGRETSLNAFSLLLSQPAERIRIWQTKISVLAVAFLTVFVVWLAAFGIALKNSNTDASDPASSYNLFITICLIATATFTGGLWTTLLLRQIAGAFWLTLLVPAVLAGITAAFLAENHSDNAVIAVLCVVLGIYSVGGFLFARWLFFHAQDVGWSGGVIALPEWKLFAASSDAANSVRRKKPIFALLKKELQLHQVSLIGATGLLVLHIGVIVLRSHHKFAKDSAGEVLTAIFWMLWLVLPVVIGAMAVAEERRLGVMEGQLCLPVSRRVQFAIKALLTLFLGTFLGGVMPMLLEGLAIWFGALNPVFTPEAYTEEFGVLLFQLSIVAFSAWLALVSFFTSTLARSFLQAIGYGIATFVGCMLLIPVFNSVHIFFLYHIFLYHVPGQSILPVVVAVPTFVVTLFWLAYLNFKKFRAGWPLWRRNLLGFAGAVVFIFVTTAALYNRVWEIFEPAEPPHGAAKFSLANPPTLRNEAYYNLLVRLPDGRVWFDYVSCRNFDNRRSWFWMFSHPLPRSVGPQKFISGSNWVYATARHADEAVQERNPRSKEYIYVDGYSDSVGVQPDGTLWVSDKSDPKVWTADKLARFGDETNWQQLARSYNLTSVLLLKKDGTLWRLGTNYFDWHDWPQKWPGLRAFKPYQIGTNSDWNEISSEDAYLARKADGSIWRVWGNAKNGKDELVRETNYDQIPLNNYSEAFVGNLGAFIRKDGTLWIFHETYEPANRRNLKFYKAARRQIGFPRPWFGIGWLPSSPMARFGNGVAKTIPLRLISPHRQPGWEFITIGLPSSTLRTASCRWPLTAVYGSGRIGKVTNIPHLC